MNDKPGFSSATTMDPAASIASTNKVLSNTYWLLALTLAFSALTATFAVAINMPQSLALVLMLVGFVLLFVESDAFPFYLFQGDIFIDIVHLSQHQPVFAEAKDIATCAHHGFDRSGKKYFCVDFRAFGIRQIIFNQLTGSENGGSTPAGHIRCAHPGNRVVVLGSPLSLL